MELLLRNKKNLINITAILLIITSVYLLFVLPIAYADNSDEGVMEMARIICSGVFNDLKDIIDSNDTAGFYATYVEATDLPAGGLKTIYDGMKLIAGLWVIAIAMSRLITNIDKGQDEMESVWKCLIEIGITLIFLMELDNIVSAIALAGHEIINWAGGATGNAAVSDDIARQLVKSVGKGQDSGDWIWELSVRVNLAIPYFLTFLVKIVARFILYQLIIEIAIRKAFMPFAVADIYQDGLRSPGARYLKKFAACFLKLAMSIAVAGMIGPLIGGVFSGGGNWPEKEITAIVLNFTAVGFMFKTGEFANDVMGV